MFYTKPTLMAMSLVQSDAVAASPWASLTQGGGIVDSVLSSHDAQMSGNKLGGDK